MDSHLEKEASTKQSSFEREALPWMEDVYRFALSLTRDPSEADDLVQETYLRAFRSWHTFQQGSDARRWLFTICRNAFLRTREKLRHEVAVDDADSEMLAAVRLQTRFAADGTDQVLSRVDLAPALTKAIDDLPEPFRSAVLLVDVEDQSYEEAAEILGVPIGTVRSRLFRGRRQLQEKLVEFARDAGFKTAAPRGETTDA
jgi:RNA polymerase sigma-70 factor, ECF subfamily